MGAPAWTPGPWTNEPGRFWICDIGNNADDPGVWSTAIPADGEPFPFGSKEADARLIAAAPELYEALSEVVTLLEGWHRLNFADEIQQQSVRLAKRALAKARGEQEPSK
jgi:hypothetical protein